MIRHLTHATATFVLSTLLVFGPWAAIRLGAAETDGVPAPGRGGKQADGRITLDVQNVNIVRVLEIIGRASGKNVVILDSVKGRMTLKLKDVPWEQALDLVLASRNYGVEISERVLLIADLAALRRIQAERERQADWAAEGGPTPIREIFSPRHVPVEDLRVELARIKSGRVAVAGRDVVVDDDPEIVSVIARIFQSLDREERPESD